MKRLHRLCIFSNYLYIHSILFSRSESFECDLCKSQNNYAAFTCPCGVKICQFCTSKLICKRGCTFVDGLFLCPFCKKKVVFDGKSVRKALRYQDSLVKSAWENIFLGIQKSVDDESYALMHLWMGIVYFADERMDSIRDMWKNFEVLDNEDMNVYITKTLLQESEFLPSQLFSSDMDVSNSSLDEIDLEISRLYLWRTNREKYDSLPLGPLEHLKFAQDGRIFISDLPSYVYNKIGPLDKVVSNTCVPESSVSNQISLPLRKKRGRPAKVVVTPINPPILSYSENATSELCTPFIQEASTEHAQGVVGVGEHIKLENRLLSSESTDSLDRCMLFHDSKECCGKSQEEESSHTIERVDLSKLCAMADDEWDMLFDFQMEYRTRGAMEMSGKDLLDSLGLCNKLSYCLSQKRRISNREGKNEYSLRKKLRELFEKDQSELVSAQNNLMLSTITQENSTARHCCKRFLDV